MRRRWRTEVGEGFTRSTWNNTTKTWVSPAVQRPRVTKLEFMQDSLHDVKRLGKTLNDIGGNLDHTLIKATLADWTPIKSYYSTRGTEDVFIPFVGNTPDGDTDDATGALLALDACTTGLYGSGVTETVVSTYIANHVTSYLDLSDLDELGASLVDAVRPTNPSVDTATTVAELFNEGKFFSLTPDSSLSGNYLNYSFGIAPTVSFVKDFTTAARSADAILEQYERDAGKLVRRQWDLPKDITSDQGSGTLWTRWRFPSDTDQGFTYDLQGGWKWDRKRVIKRRFAGAFTYPLPVEGWRRTLAEFERLYGVMPGIDTAWELVPFSFVVDYFSNAGSVLSNLNAFTLDGLVMPYGYVSEEIISDYTFSGTYSYRETPTGPLKSRSQLLELKIKQKRRRKANPFGFGVDGDLTGRQLSILAALGIQFLT